MRFHCDRQKLLEAFQVAGAVVSGRSIKQIYESVKVISREDRLELLATDLEVAIRYSLPEVEVDQGGALTVPAARMTSILREMKDERVEVAWEDGATLVVGDNSQFKVLGEDPEEFPQIPDMEGERVFSIASETFRDLVGRTAFAAAKERTRFALNGILFLIQGSEVRCVTTDGRRLALVVGEVENPEEVEVKAIVPAKGMTQIVRTLTEADETLELRVEENQATARTSRAVVASRLVEGAFPDWQDVIPASCSYEMDLDREALTTALRKAKLLTNQESRSVRLHFTEGRLIIASRALEVGEARVELEVPFDGPDLEIGFNPDYLLEALGAIRAPTFKLGLNGPTSPGRITDGATFTYVVMPVSLE
jgi:DNA polymerase-3 subunit beta